MQKYKQGQSKIYNNYLCSLCAFSITTLIYSITYR